MDFLLILIVFVSLIFLIIYMIGEKSEQPNLQVASQKLGYRADETISYLRGNTKQWQQEGYDIQFPELSLHLSYSDNPYIHPDTKNCKLYIHGKTPFYEDVEFLVSDYEGRTVAIPVVLLRHISSIRVSVRVNEKTIWYVCNEFSNPSGGNVWANYIKMNDTTITLYPYPDYGGVNMSAGKPISFKDYCRWSFG